MTFGSGEVLTLPGVVAGGDLSSSQWKLVKMASTAKEVVVASAATDRVVGVVMNDPADGEEALVGVLGPTKVLAEASVSIGDYVASSTTGRAKTTTTANDEVVGIALEASSTAGDLITVLLVPSNF